MKITAAIRCDYKLVFSDLVCEEMCNCTSSYKNESRRYAEPFFCWTIYKASDNYERQANEQSYAEPIQQAIDPPNQQIGENEDW